MPTIRRKPGHGHQRHQDHPHNHGLDKPMFGFFTPSNNNESTPLHQHFVAASGEFVGTYLFLFTAYLGMLSLTLLQYASMTFADIISRPRYGKRATDTCELNPRDPTTNTHPQSVQFAPTDAPGGGNANQTVVFIALSYGFSLLIAAWVLYRVSGGLFNPAVTLGMVITGTLPPMRGLVLLPAQLLGGICAAAVVSVIIPVDIALVQTTLAPNMNVAQGLFLEMVRDKQTPQTLKVSKLPNLKPSNSHPYSS